MGNFTGETIGGQVGLEVGLEDLRAGDRVAGIDPAGPVTFVSATIAGHATWSIVFRMEGGALHETIPYRDKEQDLEVSGPAPMCAFVADGDPKNQLGPSFGANR